MLAAAPRRPINRVSGVLDILDEGGSFEESLELTEHRLKATKPQVDKNIFVWSLNYLKSLFPDAQEELESDWTPRQIVEFATSEL